MIDPANVFLDLKVICGEYEFHCLSVHQIDKVDYERKIEKFAENYAANFYGLESEAKNGAYYFYAGEVAVSVYKVQELQSQEYLTLKKYL